MLCILLTHEAITLCTVLAQCITRNKKKYEYVKLKNKNKIIIKAVIIFFKIIFAFIIIMRIKSLYGKALIYGFMILHHFCCIWFLIYSWGVSIWDITSQGRWNIISISILSYEYLCFILFFWWRFEICEILELQLLF